MGKTESTKCHFKEPVSKVRLGKNAQRGSSVWRGYDVGYQISEDVSNQRELKSVWHEKIKISK